MHCTQIKHPLILISWASPWWTSKNHSLVLLDFRSVRFEISKAVVVYPSNEMVAAINCGVALATCEGRRVFLDGDHVRPAVGEGEGDGIAANAGKEVNDGGFGGRYGGF